MEQNQVVQGVLLTVHLCPACKGSGRGEFNEYQNVCCGHLEEVSRNGIYRKECYGSGCRGMQQRASYAVCTACDGRKWVWRDEAVTHAILAPQLAEQKTG